MKKEQKTMLVLAMIMAFMAGGLFWPELARTESPAPVERTGQTLSFETRDDGYLEKGVDWPHWRFTDNGDGTVTDNLTGLIWLKDANCICTRYPDFDQDSTPQDGAVTWPHALQFVAGINNGTYAKCGAGTKDWRLPNIKELESLVHYGRSFPALPDAAGTEKWTEGQPFSNVQSEGGQTYWSSTTRPGPPGVHPQAWGMCLWYGFTTMAFKDLGEHSDLYVWPVRDGATGPAPVEKTGQEVCYDIKGNIIPCIGTGQDGEYQKKGINFPFPRFTDNGDGTVTDNLTGLIWLKNAQCFDGRNWYQALTDCNGLHHGDCGLSDHSNAGDWRLPNIKELESLVHYGFVNPALPNTNGTGQWTEGQPFSNVQWRRYWSSTTRPHPSIGNYAFMVRFSDGLITNAQKEHAQWHLVWPVRGGSD